MNSLLYHQKQKLDSKGRNIFIGEDAYPYADDEIIIVADGLGGRGGYPHTKIDKRIVDKELFYDLVFSPIFDKDVSEEFRNFVVNSFDEIFATKDYYFENTATMRSSGYFASRLVSAITLYELKYNDLFNKERLFSSIDEVIDKQKDDVAQKYGDKLSEILQKKLSIVAKNIGLEIETKISGAYLLPSTLTAAVMDSKNDHVDVVYFWAGDSRGYAWDVNGLYQLTEDHEKDETMTNLITLTKPFRIESRFISILKPCLLFNATDGCYKCPVFGSPFDLEYIFLKSIDESSDWNKVADYLSRQFYEIGTHDDSNTMALASFGFNNYGEVQDTVRTRLKYIHDNIIAQLPGILEVDYPVELQKVEEQIKSNVIAIKNQLIEQESVISFVANEMGNGKYPVLINEEKELIDKISLCQTEKKRLSEEIKRWVKEHWIEYPQLKKISNVANDFKTIWWGKQTNPYEIYKSLKANLAKLKRQFNQAIDNKSEELRIKSNKIVDCMEKLKDYKQRGVFKQNEITDNIKQFLQILSSIGDMSQGKDSITAEYKKTEDEIKILNEKYANNDKESIATLCELIFDNKVDFSRIERPEEEVEPIKTLANRYCELDKNILSFEAEKRGLSDKYLLMFWNERYKQLIYLIWTEHKDLIPDALLETINRGINDIKTKQSELELSCKKREEIYSEYEKSYKKYVKKVEYSITNNGKQDNA